MCIPTFETQVRFCVDIQATECIYFNLNNEELLLWCFFMVQFILQDLYLW